MFSGLSKLADKAFVLGFFLPALLGIFAFLGANSDEPCIKTMLDSALASKKAPTDLVTVVAAVWIFAVFLMAINHWTYRLLEGYIGLRRPFFRKAQLARRAKAVELARLYSTQHETAVSEMQRMQRAMGVEDLPITHPLRQEETRLAFQYWAALEKYARENPNEPANVLATRFGNVLRAFEMYPTDVYGADSIFVWPRLTAVIPSSYQAVIVDARASVDFLVSLIVMAGFISFIALVRAFGLWLSNAPDADKLILRLFGISFGGFATARICYEIAISAAARWGDVVKSAFDLYLPALVKALGFEVPDTLEKQMAFWDEWNAQFRFHVVVDRTGWVRSGVSKIEETKGENTEGAKSEKKGGKGEDAEAGDDTDKDDDDE